MRHMGISRRGSSRRGADRVSGRRGPARRLRDYDPPVTRPAPDPLAGTDRLLVDGSNLLHAWRRGPEALPAAALIGRLRGAVPPQIGIELVLDGPPDRGMHNARVASGLIVRYSGRRTADEVLVALVDEAAAAGHTASRRAILDNILVVSDDRDLRHALQQRGVRTAGAQWLIGRLQRERLESPSTGNPRPPGPPPGDAAREEARDERPGWRPGRGATTKRGNPKRGRRPPPA